MDRRQYEETVEGSRSHQSTLTGTLALKNFTIPRKKRYSGEVYLEYCSEGSRDHSFIQTKLNDFKLDTRKDRANSWFWKDICLVHNEELLRKFSEKRAEMRAKGRHGREMEERFCFLAATDQMTSQIYQRGLQVGSTTQHALGKPSYGAYLFKHVDVAIKSASTSAKKLFIFKVLYGKVKKIAPSLEWNKTPDPTVAFDCHMCKDAVSHRDTLHQQVLGSAVFLFDFNEKQELNERPRQCLPYAVASFSPLSSSFQTVPLNLQSSTLPIGQVHVNSMCCSVCMEQPGTAFNTAELKLPEDPALSTDSDPTNCFPVTALENTIDNFKACTVAERRGKGNSATITFKRFVTPGCFETSYTPQKADMQNTQSLNTKQDWVTASEDLGSSEYCSVPVVDHTAPSQNRLGKNCFLSNHTQNAAQNDNKRDTVPQTPLDKISTIVYSSHFARDPRLSRQKVNQQSTCSKAGAANIDSETDDGKSKPDHQNQEDYRGFGSEEWSSMNQKDDQRDSPLESLKNNQREHSAALPSIRLFKMKFHKYAAYLRMNEEERCQKIWSLENMSEEQKQGLVDSINFYDVYYQKYKKGLLFQKPNQTTSQSQTETKQNIAMTKCKLECVDAGSASDNSDLLTKVDCSSTYIHKTKHPDHPKSNTVVLTEMGEISSNLNLTNKKNDLKKPSPLTYSFNEPKLNHSVKEVEEDIQENESNQGVNLDERPNIDSSSRHANNTIMDITSFIDVSSCCNLFSAMAEKEQKNVKSSNSVKHSEISPQLDVETVQQNNSFSELYKRLDQLLQSKNQKPVFSIKAYLRPKDTISNPKKDREAATEDPHFTVTLKANRTSTDNKKMLSLSERFSQLRCQTKMARRNNKTIQTPETQMCSSEENATYNAELIQLLAQKYNKSEILKYKRLSRSGNKKTFFKKHSTSLCYFLKRSKYIKKTHFWLAKKNLSRKIVTHANVNAEVTIDCLSQTVLTENKDTDSNFRITSQTSENDDGAQKANESMTQSHSCPTNTEMPLSQELIVVPGTKEKPINLTETSSDDFCKIDSLKKTKDFTSFEIPFMEDGGEQVKAVESSSSQNQTSLFKSTTKGYTKEHREESMLPKGTSETELNPLKKDHYSVDNNVDASENLATTQTHSDMAVRNNSHKTKVQTTMTPEDQMMDTITETSETGSIKQCFEGREDTPNVSKSDLDISTNTSNVESDPALSGQCEISELTINSNTDMVSVPKSPETLKINDKSELPMPEQNKNDTANSPETQLISKLRDYLSKFESTVKKQESVREDQKERPVLWITLDSTAHKQQLFEKGQYCMVNLPCLVPNESDNVTKGNGSECTEFSVQTNKVPQSEHAQVGTDVCLIVPVQSKRGRQSSQFKRARRHKSSRSSVTSVSPDSTSALDSRHLPLYKENHQTTGSPEISFNNDQIHMQRKTTTDQQKTQVNLNSGQKSTVNIIENIDDGNVSSTLAGNEYNMSDISDTLKMADQTSSLTELGSLQSKCKNMLEHFISSFERDQKMPFKQSFVSRHLILDQYLDHPPAEVDLKYEAINSYLELQMMMEALQFVENKMNFLRSKPTFRSLLWYDSSLYGELYKGDVGFQQQSSLFASFQNILSQEGYSKLQEYYRAVSSLHQPLLVAPDTSYYMYLKSKRELLEAEAALRNPHDMKSFFLSVPIAATINFGNSLEKLEKVHKIIMTFVETPSDQLPGIFDVGKAEHLSIICRYLQEKGLFIRSCKEGIGKISWFGIEHLLYDASKVLVWQDMDRGAPNEALETYKNSNPQIIFGVTESGVTLVNKVEQPALSTDGPTQQKSDAARKRKCLQLWMSSEPSVAQSRQSDKELEYKMAKRRVSHPPVAHCGMNEKGLNPLFQTTPAAPVENPSPYYAHPQRMDPQWGMVRGNGIDWNTPNFVPPSTSHVHSEIKSHLLSKRRRTFSHTQERRSFSDVQRHQWPSVSNSQGDSCVTHSAFESVKYQQNNTAHIPGQVNQFSLAMTQPYSLPNCPVNPNLVPSPLAVQALTHVTVPNNITTIHYPYFLFNGQTYTTGSTGAIHPNTRYYPSTI